MTILQYVILGIILSTWPLLFELATEGYRTKVLGRRDKHFLTGLIRSGFILAAGFGNPLIIFWWQGSLLAFCTHYLFFDGLFNHWILDKPPGYRGRNFWDRVHGWIADRITLAGLYGIRLIAWASSIKFYIDPYIW